MSNLTTKEQDYVVAHLTGFSLVTADTHTEAWARYIADDCLALADDKAELRSWLLENGYKKLQATEFSNVYRIIK